MLKHAAYLHHHCRGTDKERRPTRVSDNRSKDLTGLNGFVYGCEHTHTTPRHT
jgi:hypothetical protein